jgi:hypothetical protein
MKEDPRLPRAPGVPDDMADEDAANDGPPESSPAPRAKPARNSATPKPSRASLTPKPARTSVTPRPSRASVTPKPSRASLTPKPSEASETPAPEGVTRSRRAPKMESEAPRSRRTPPPPQAKSTEPTPRPGSTSKAKPPVKAKARNRKKGDLDDSSAQKFFAEGEAAVQQVDPSEFGLPSERQSAFKRYVYILVGVCAVVLVYGVLRSVFSTPPPPPAHSEPAPVVAAPPIPPPPPEPVAAPQASAPAPVASAAASAAPAASGSAAPADSSAAAVSTKTEEQERDDARRLLERGKSKDAAEAAARATALDPTDGDAWLFLGAADMDLGKAADAREAFTQCVKQGKRGQISECRSMLH